MGGRLSRRRKGYEAQAEAAAAGIVETTGEAAQEVSATLAEGAAAASQEVSSTLEATAEVAAEVVKEAIAAAESVPAAVSEEPKAEEVADVTQEVVSTAVADVPSAEVTVPLADITSVEPAPVETAPEPEKEAIAAEEPIPEPAEEPATAEPESAPEPIAEAVPNTETEEIQSESADPAAETVPGLLAGTVSDLISTSASGAEEAAETKADDTGAPSEEAAVENGDCEITDSSAGPPVDIELNSESQEQVLQPAVGQLAEECFNSIGLPTEPPKEQTDCEIKKDWELPEAIGDLGEAVSDAVNQVVDLV